jgi:hypothetical protein
MRAAICQEARKAIKALTLSLLLLSVLLTGLASHFTVYGDDLDYECWLVPGSVTRRHAVVIEVTVDSKYIGAYFSHKCPYNPEGPHGSSDFVLTVQFADRRVDAYSGFLSRDTNWPGAFWRLYGPLDFSPPAPP